MNLIQQTVKSLFGSMQLRCPVCDAALDMSSINKHEELALCPACGGLSKLTDLIRADGSMGELVAKPPAGCTVLRVGDSINVSVSLRSIPKFLGYLWEAILWNGILSIFVILLLSAYYNIFIGPVPNWVPFTKKGIVIINDAPVNLKMALSVTLFLTPFVVNGAKFIFEALIRFLGRTSVIIGERDSYVSTGVGILLWRRRFDNHQIRTLATTDIFWGFESPTNKRLKIESNKPIKFGVYLDHEQCDGWKAFSRYCYCPIKQIVARE